LKPVVMRVVRLQMPLQLLLLGMLPPILLQLMGLKLVLNRPTELRQMLEPQMLELQMLELQMLKP
jgi:hypothetical protein